MTINQAKILRSALYDAQLMELRYIESLPAENIVNSERVDNFVRELADGFKEKKKTGLGKRFILILVAAIISILLIVSISASDAIRNFFVNIYEISIYEDHILITSNEDYNKENLEEPMQEFVTSYVPKGYIKTISKNHPALIDTYWNNGEHGITLSQTKLQNAVLYLDNEAEYHTLVSNGKTIYYMHKHNSYFAIWSDSEYIFSITCHDSVSLEELEKIISSIAPIDVSE